MKYIVNVPEDRIHNGVLCVMGTMEDGVCHYLPTGIKAMPYDESEAEKRGQEEAWEIAQKILKDPSKDGMLNTELNNCFGTDDIYLIGEMSYAEVSKKYETWKKSKDEIKIGDEIAFYHDDGRLDTVAIVTHVSQVFVDGMEAKGTLYANKSPKKWTKTGKTFPEVVELLEKVENHEKMCEY